VDDLNSNLPKNGLSNSKFKPHIDKSKSSISLGDKEPMFKTNLKDNNAYLLENNMNLLLGPDKRISKLKATKDSKFIEILKAENKKLKTNNEEYEQ
jgi:hypothetical protein